MTKENFEKKYGAQLNLSEKKWFLMSPKANKDNNLVLISGYREIDFDYLYFIYKDEVWEMYLDGNIRYYEDVPYTTRELFQLVLNTKKSIEYFPPANKILYRSSGVKGQVIVALDYFATKIKSVLDPVVTIEVPKEVLETKSTVFTGIHINKKVDLFEKFEEDAHKEVAAEVFGTKHVLEELRDFLKSLGYHTSIVDYVTKNTDVLFIKQHGEWDMNYLDALIENAKFEENNCVKLDNTSGTVYNSESGYAWKELAELNSKDFVEEVKIRTFESGSMRDDDSQKPLVNHLDPYVRLRYGYLLRNGANKYSKNNWRFGQPNEVALESLHRHLAKYELNLRNNIPQEEDHLSSIIFGVQLLMMNEEKAGIKVDEYVGTTK